MKKLFGMILLVMLCCSLMVGCGGNAGNGNAGDGNNSADKDFVERHSDEDTIVLNDYVKVKFSGYNGYASSKATLDYTKLVEDYKEHFDNIKMEYVIDADSSTHSHCSNRECVELNDCISCPDCNFNNCDCMLTYNINYYDSNNESEIVYQTTIRDRSINGSSDLTAPVAIQFYEAFCVGKIRVDNYDLDGTENNEMVRVSFANTPMETMGKILGVEVVGDDFDYKVEGLKDVVKVDPFKEFTVETRLDGQGGYRVTNVFIYYTAGNGDWQTKSLLQGDLVVDCFGKENDISNGDKIKISFKNEIDKEQLAREEGVIFTRTEAEVKVYGLNEGNGGAGTTGKKATVDLADYISFDAYNGYNGISSFSVDINWEKLMLDHKDSINTNIVTDNGLFTSAVNSIVYRFESYGIVQEIGKLNASSVWAEKEKLRAEGNGLKNGDKVTLILPDMSQYTAHLDLINIEFKNTTFEYTVEGLKKPREMDIFQNYKVYYSGKNGQGTVEVITCYFIDEEGNVKDTSFSVSTDNNGALSNGDIFLINLENGITIENLFYDEGVIPTRTQIEITVEGLE